MSSDTDSRIQRLLDRYRELNPDRRWNIVDELERYSSHRVDGLVPYIDTLSELLKWETGGTAVQLAELLQSCLADNTESIETEALTSLTELTRSNNRATRQVGFEALKILYRRDPTAIDGDFTPEEIEDWLEGGPEDRALGYRILGVTLAEGAIPRLADAQEPEVDPAKKAAREALEDIGSISATLLREENPRDGATNLEQLASHTPEIAVEHQAEIRNGLTADSEAVAKSCATALIKLGYSEYCDQLDDRALFDALHEFKQEYTGRAAGVIIGGQSEIDSDIVPTILEWIEDPPRDDQQHVHLVTLLQISERQPQSVAQYEDRLRNLDSQLTGRARVDYLKLLGEMISVAKNPGRLAPLLIRELKSSSDEHVKNACRNLAETNLYPLPHAVNQARNNENPSISSAAHKIYQRSTPPEFPVTDHLSGNSGNSAIEKLESALHYQTQPGRWDPLSIPQSERQGLAKVREQYDNDSGGYMLLPHDVPEMGILTAAELAISGIKDGEETDILIYTPGTGSQWGTYDDLQTVFEQLGLTADTGITTAALPIDEVVSVCRLIDGEVIEWEDTDSNARIILTQSLEDIQTISADGIIFNFLGRRPAEIEERIDDIRDDLSSLPVFSLYSFTAKIEAPGTWPEYGYPESVPETSPNLLPGAPPAAEESRTEQASMPTPGNTVTDQLLRLREDRSLTVERLGGGEIAERLQTMHYLAHEMESSDTSRIAKEFKKQTRFVQSLPVPLDTWNTWVREESTGTGRYANDPSYQRLDDINDLREDPPNATVPGTVYDYLVLLKELFEILRQQNPVYHRLLEEIESCIESDEQLAVLFRKRSTQQAFRYALRKNRGLSEEELRQKGIHILRPDGLRQVKGVDNLIMTHPLPPSQTQFYLSPLYETLHLIGYDKGTDDYVSNCVVERREKLRSRQQVPEDVNWPVEPAIDTIEPPSEDIEMPDYEVDEGVTTRDLENDSTITEMWAQFEPEFGSDPTDVDTITTGNGGDSWSVQILTDEGTEIIKSSDHSVLVERSRGSISGSQYVWIQMKDLQPDDNFILIPDRTRERLFSEALESVYGGGLEGTDLLKGLETWWKSLREIWTEYDDFETIYTLLNQNGIEKSKGAVKDWFEAVRRASSPLELPMDPDLRIGPDSADDIRVIGETFGYPTLVEDSVSIERAMQLSRGMNRSKGRELNEWIVSRIKDNDTDLLENVAEYTVGTIRHLGRQR